MKSYWFAPFFWIVSFVCPIEASTVLQERLASAKIGDYIVTESNKMVSILAVRHFTSQSIILEEINVPVHLVDPRPHSWSQWVRDHAPGHSSWSMLEIDLENHQLIECYSFSRSSWVQLSQEESLISTIFGLALQPVNAKEQRRIGPQPMEGEIDTRKIWKPSLFQDGKQIESIEFEVFEAIWPKDGSELADKNVFFYFDREGRTPFPAWIQLTTPHAAASIRMIDSGQNLPAHFRSMPRRVPEFIDVPQKTEAGLRLSIKSPRYYHNFDLFVVDVTTTEKEIFPITHSLSTTDGETIHLEIAQSDLKKILHPNHRYTWLIVPHGHCEYYSESSRPFLWKE